MSKTHEDVEQASASPSPGTNPEETGPKRTAPQRLWATFKEPGSALQIVLAAAIAIAIGISVSATTENIPEAVPVIIEIPGTLWLRALRATGKNHLPSKHIKASSQF